MFDENIQTENKQVTNDFVAILTIGAVPGADPPNSVRELEDAEPCTQCADPRCSLRHAELRAHRRARPGREGSRGKLHQVSRRGCERPFFVFSPDFSQVFKPGARLSVSQAGGSQRVLRRRPRQRQGERRRNLS